MQPISLLCRACGAPSDGVVAGELGCRYCGERTRVDAETGQRLAFHAAMMRRAVAKARCVLRERLMAMILPAALFRMKVYLYGALAVLLVVVPVLVIVAGLALAMGQDMPRDPGQLLTPIDVVALIAGGLGLVLGVGVFPLALTLGFREGKKADVHAARAARAAEPFVEATVATQCPHCGGHAQLVILGLRSSVPCPWCAAPLQPAQADATAVAGQAVIAARQRVSDRLLRNARTQAGLREQSKVRLQVPGFALEGGIHHGVMHGVPAWIAFDAMVEGVHQRIEVERPTRLKGAVWFVPSAFLPAFSQLLERENQVLPPRASADPEIDARVSVFAEAGVEPSAVAAVAAAAAVRALVWRCDAREAICIDPAGGSIWRLRRGAFGGDSSALLSQVDALVRAVWEVG